MGKKDSYSSWVIPSKYFLYTFNVVSLILALAILILALYIRYEWDFKHYVIELEAYQIWTGPYILMASSSLTLLMSFFGCWATANENPFLLLVFIGVNGATVVLGMAGLAYALDHGITFSKLTPWLENRFLFLVFDGAYNERSARIVRIMQENLGCCGGTGWQNYDDYNNQIPSECRNKVTGNMYTYGCGIIFSDFVEVYMAWLSGMALLLVVLQMMAMTAAFILRRAVKQQIKNESRDYTPVKTRI